MLQIITLLSLISLRSAFASDAEGGFKDLVLAGKTATFAFNFTDKDFNSLWTVWDKRSRQEAKQLSPDERKKMIYKRYGFDRNPYNEKLPLGLVFRKKNLIGINCMVCHSSSLNGSIIYGRPNWRIDLKSFSEDIGKLKPIFGLPATFVAKTFGPQRGMINPISEVAFGIMFRNKDMSLSLIPRVFIGIDDALVNPMPWWNAKYKTHYFADASSAAGPRIFTSVASMPSDTGKTYRSKEKNVENILAFAETTKAPIYPGFIDLDFAAKGKKLFTKSCSKCHGSPGESFPNKLIHISKVKTDPNRVINRSAIRAQEYFWKSWIGNFGKDDFQIGHHSYLAPPLDGIWASAPYLHNGSVPTLYDLFFPDERPRIWLADDENYDYEKVGLKYTRFSTIYTSSKWERRRYFDTQIKGASNGGHYYTSKLNTEERLAILEYLKTI